MTNGNNSCITLADLENVLGKYNISDKENNSNQINDRNRTMMDGESSKTITYNKEGNVKINNKGDYTHTTPTGTSNFRIGQNESQVIHVRPGDKVTYSPGTLNR